MSKPSIDGKKRVLMVLPNQRWSNGMEWSVHPYAVCSIIAVIRDEYTVDFLDANVDNLSVAETAARIKVFRPDVVGVSVMANAYKTAGFMVAEEAKKIDPDIATVIGGVYPTTRAESAMECKHLDYACIGEGEDTFPRLLRYIFGETTELPEEGVAYREGGEVKIRPRVSFIQDLDAFPLPDYTLVDYRKYSKIFRNSVDAPRALPYGKMMTSRGCPIGCTFCQVEDIMGRRVRYKSIDRVIAEVDSLVQNFGIRALEFDDDQLIGKVRRGKELFAAMAAQNWDLVWNAMNISVFLMDEEMVDLMYASGCRYLSLAIESGVPRVLKEIVKKPVQLDQAKRIADYAKSIGIDTTSLFIIGFPGETWDEIRQTIDYAEYLDTDYVKFNVATAFPGTQLYQMAVEQKVIDPGFDFDDIHWGEAGISTDEWTADQMTLLRIFEWDRVNFSKPEKRRKIAQMMRISEAELERIRIRTRSVAAVNNGIRQVSTVKAEDGDRGFTQIPTVDNAGLRPQRVA